MDRVLRETVAWAEAETARGHGGVMVLLMGDHGQTVNGDHGGATAEVRVRGPKPLDDLRKEATADGGARGAAGGGVVPLCARDSPAGRGGVGRQNLLNLDSKDRPKIPNVHVGRAAIGIEQDLKKLSVASPNDPESQISQSCN